MLKSHFQKLVLLFFLVMPSCTVSAGEMPYILGVNVHHADFLQSPIYNPVQSVKALKEYQFDSFRDTLGWSTFNAEKSWVFPSALRNFKYTLDDTKDLEQPLLVFTSGDPSYNNGYLPTTPDQREKALDFIKRATEATKDYHPIYELWNEWNLATGTRKKVPGTPEDYVAFIKQAYPAVKAIASKSTVLVGGMATDVDPVPVLKREWVWTKKAIDLGMLDYGDAVSVHLYNICRAKDERRPSEAIGRLEKLIKIIADKTGNPAYPIYITETGWPEKMKGCGFTPEEQISFSAQFLFWLTKYPSVKGVWIYELKDSGKKPENIEHHFGFLHYDYSPKPMACVLNEVNKILSDSSFSSEKISQSDNRIDFVMKKKGGAPFDLIWLPEKTGTPSYIVPKGKVARFVCDSRQYQEGMSVDLSELPLVVTDKGASGNGL